MRYDAPTIGKDRKIGPLARDRQSEKATIGDEDSGSRSDRICASAQPHGVLSGAIMMGEMGAKQNVKVAWHF